MNRWPDQNPRRPGQKPTASGSEVDPEIWELLAEMAPPPSDSPVPGAETLLAKWAAGRTPAGRGGSGPFPVRTLRPRWAPVGLAAAVVFLGGWWLGRALQVPVPGAPEGVAEVIAEAEGPATMQLPDGSLVRVAQGGRVQYTGSAEAREVWLEGHAFFAVARDSERPFRVRGPSGEAVALGTRFDLNSTTSGLHLVVVEGRVALSTPHERVEVGAGERSDVRDGRVSAPVSVPNVQDAIGWMGRVLVFQNTPLDAVAREVEDRYGVAVELAEPSMAQRTVTAWFGDQPANQVLEAICRAVDARCHVSEGRTTLAP